MAHLLRVCPPRRQRHVIRSRSREKVPSPNGPYVWRWAKSTVREVVGGRRRARERRIDRTHHRRHLRRRAQKGLQRLVSEHYPRWGLSLATSGDIALAIDSRRAAPDVPGRVNGPNGASRYWSPTRRGAPTVETAAVRSDIFWHLTTLAIVGAPEPPLNAGDGRVSARSDGVIGLTEPAGLPMLGRCRLVPKPTC